MGVRMDTVFKALVFPLLLGICATAFADTSLQRRERTYGPICEDYERSKQYAECHRPPGSYLRAFEMTGEARKRALAQGRKLIRMRKGTNRDLDTRRKLLRVNP